MGQLSDKTRRLLSRGLEFSGPIVVLTGAGVSAESGIPTFRGEDGYWKVGSRHYHPQELATHAAFSDMPHEVWSWYLYRRGVCANAVPNSAHVALAQLSHHFQHRLLLVTQNVDGLHQRSGFSEEQIFTVHGNIQLMRFDEVGDRVPRSIPSVLDVLWEKGRLITDRELDWLRHSSGVLGRPHVLWFDEYYDEELFRFQSSLQAAASMSLFVVIGTSGSTNLPLQMAQVAVARDVPWVVINKDADSEFVNLATASPNGDVILGEASMWVPLVVQELIDQSLATGARIN